MKNNNVLNKTKGCLVGLACGDYLGMPYEFMLPYRVKAHFRSHRLEPVSFRLYNKDVAGYYTDDTSLAICLAESLVEKDFSLKDQFRRYKKWLIEGYSTPDGDRAYGVGQQTLKSLTRQQEDSLPNELVNNTKAGGNGALMRCAPISLRYFEDSHQLAQKSIASAVITHNNIIASYSCVVLNTFINYALQGLYKESFCERFITETLTLPPELQRLLQIDFNTINEDELITTGYSLNTLTIALYAFLITDTFNECLTKAIAIGGDTDTQGAVAGALAGAYYGFNSIPQVWKKTLMRHQYIEELAVRLYEKAAN